MTPFSTILRREIEASGMSQADVARNSDISIAMVTKLLSGARRNPGRDVMDRLARTLKISPERFFQ